MTPYGLGRLPSPDTRDGAYRMRAVEKALVQRKQAYRLGSTLDQGDTPSCVGHSCRHKLSAAPLMVKADIGPSAMLIYQEAQDRDEWDGHDYEGTSVRGGFKYLQELGYLKSYVWALTRDEGAAFLLGNQGSIVVGTNWYDSMFEPHPTTGVLTLPVSKRVTPVGGHAYHWFWTDGYYDFYQNSWGAGWGVTLNGKPGCFKLRVADTARLLREEGEMGAGIERAVKVKA